MDIELMELENEYNAICRECGERNTHSWVKRAMILMKAQNEKIRAMRSALDSAETELLDAERYSAADLCRKAMGA